MCNGLQTSWIKDRCVNSIFLIFLNSNQGCNNQISSQSQTPVNSNVDEMTWWTTRVNLKTKIMT